MTSPANDREEPHTPKPGRWVGEASSAAGSRRHGALQPGLRTLASFPAGVSTLAVLSQGRKARSLEG